MTFAWNSITTKMLAGLLITSLVPLLIISEMFLSAYERNVEKTELHYLAKISEKKFGQINTYIDTLINNIEIIAKAENIKDNLISIERTYNTTRPDSEKYRRHDENLRAQLSYILDMGYYDLFLISNDGTIVFTLRHEDDFTTNILIGPYRDSGLSKATRDSTATLESSVSDFQFYPPSNEAAAFIATPIIHQGKVLGVLALQIDIDRVFDVINDNTGMGRTGQSNIGRIINHTIYFNGSLKSTFIDSETALKASEDTDIAAPMRLALNGHSGKGISTDLFGNSVIATWNYLPVFNWGFVIKKDTDEAFSSVRQVKHISRITFAILFIFILILSYFINYSISNPIKSLVNAVNSLPESYNQRVSISTTDEIGQLGHSFNKMASQLQTTLNDLKDKIREADNANQSKSRFLSRMSHELRTPLNAILGFGQLLEMDAENLDHAQKDNIKEIVAAGLHLLKLIDEVLDLGKIESGSIDLAIETINLDDLLQECIPLVINHANEHQIELINHISHKKSVVKADNVRLKEVLLNLLSNAIKYNRKGGHVTMDSEIIDSRYLRLSVTNTGKGLSDNEIAKLFTPFERLDMVNIEGTGMGLVITKYLVELMGGHISINSIIGESSTFLVDLPLPDNANKKSIPKVKKGA